MSIQRKFILLFVSFTLFVALLIAAVSIGFLKETYDRILHAANASYLPVMASHMFFKAFFTFAIIIFVVVIVSIPLGVILSRRLTAPYMRIFKNLGTIAQKRLDIDKKDAFAANERKLLEKYMGLLVEDLNNLKEYEKVKSWKDGARLLMHELKNPLTPLKLSAQSLMLVDNDPKLAHEEINRILASVQDVEKILSYFKELVNIEFGPLTSLDIKDHVRAFAQQVKPALTFPCSMSNDAKAFIVLSEPTLVTMLFTNLIKNGISENAREFYVEVLENVDLIKIRFITPNAHIDETSKIFSLGYSTKGKNRGFGLFLCKKIADYLDLNIQFTNEAGNIVFTVDFKRYGAT